MGLRVTELAILVCVCAFGIQCAYSFIQNMREIEQNCARDGGYCINVIPPPPPRRRNRGQGGPGAGRMGTRTRKGQRQGPDRPDPRALGAQNERLPAGVQAQAPAQGQATGAATDPAAQQNTGLFGTSPNDPFNSIFPFMMFTRKKRQAAMEPGEFQERPRIRRGESMYQFLNAHCRKSEFDFGCRQTGGMCCLPFL